MKLNVAALKLAVRKAAEWKGSLMPDDYPAFDAEIEEMRQAVRTVERMKREHAQLVAFVEEGANLCAYEDVVRSFRNDASELLKRVKP